MSKGIKTESLPVVVLERQAYMDFGTYGVLRAGDIHLVTAERPWMGNRPRVSCIPTGVYHCRPRRYYKGGYDSWELNPVPGRSHILIHKGNIPTHSAGCVLVGSRFSLLSGIWSVASSAQAYEALYERFGGQEFCLKIVNRIGGNPQ